MSADLEHIRQIMREADCLYTEAEVEAAIARVGVQINAELAESTSVEITMLFAHLWGGQVIYVPKGVLIQASKMHQKIFDDWTGRNHHEVAKKYGVSVQYVYRIVKRMRLAIIAFAVGVWLFQTQARLPSPVLIAVLAALAVLVFSGPTVTTMFGPSP